MKKIALSILFYLAISTCFAQITNGLIFYYPFNNGNDDNQANTAFSTILGQGTSPTSDALGNANSALAFAAGGSHQQLWVTSAGLIDFGLTTSFSFVSDVKSVSTAQQWFFRDLLTSGVGWDIGFLNNTGYVTFEAGKGNTAVTIRTTSTYNDNAWHQVALLVDKSSLNIRIYVDGVQQDLTGTVCGTTVNDSIVSISGCNFNANEDNAQLTALGDYMVGAMDEIRLYNRLITPQEVTTLYNKSFVPTPMLVSPANNSANEDPANTLFQWTSVPNATGYELEYDTNMAFPSPIQLTPTNTNTSLSTLSQGTTYYWRVRAVVPSGYSDWSPIWEFATASPLAQAPTLILPMNGANNIDPLTASLSWSTVANAAEYELHYDVNNTFSFPTIIKQPGNAKLLSVLSSNTTYYWRVRATNVLGSSPFSPTWSFTTAYPASIEDSFFEHVTLFPNPTSGKLMISDLPPQGCEIIVYDALGKRLFSTESKRSQLQVDVSGFTQGIYYLHIRKGGHDAVTKFVKK